jgi:hypothetical protein
MKTSMNLAIAFILGLLVALSLQPSQAATKTYDAVKLAEYSACLSQASGTYADPIYDQTNPQRVLGVHRINLSNSATSYLSIRQSSQFVRLKNMRVTLGEFPPRVTLICFLTPVSWVLEISLISRIGRLTLHAFLPPKVEHLRDSANARSSKAFP